MEKIGAVVEGITPCDHCGQPAIQFNGSGAQCADCTRSLKSASVDTESMRDGISLKSFTETLHK